jgi:hypothetical protein
MTTPETFAEMFAARDASHREQLHAIGERLESAVVGDVVTIDGRVSVTAERCEHARTAFYCLPCHQPLANVFQLTCHLESAGRHVIARDCRHHGLEEL